MQLRVILTGATGMVGEGVLYECILHPDVTEILVIGRKPSGKAHPKLKEIVHSNFHDLSGIADQLKGYNACFFCIGVSSVGMSETDYTAQTFTLTTAFADSLAHINSNITFCYISGAGTDSTEKGRSMWARVKGRTENALTRMPFRKVYNFRPGFLQPTKGLKNTLKMYTYLGFLYPVINFLMPRFVSTLGQLGRAMIHVASKGYEKTIIEVRDIRKLSDE